MLTETAALHMLFASPTSEQQDYNPQPKLVLIYRPHDDERLSWPNQMWVNFLLKEITCHGWELNPVPPDLQASVLTTIDQHASVIVGEV
jgi:hypothetical protein